ncbi:MAG: tetratricopeptide repeat protein [Candidatus Delongbacteria bacterium]|nr:tetratricopeptide repeat protein [Candidatus Delongbacteria bacterium]
MFSLFSTTLADKQPAASKPLTGKSRTLQLVSISILICIWMGLMSFGIMSMFEPEWLQNLTSIGKYQEAKDYKNMADNLMRQGNIELAISHYTHALQIKPDYTDARVNLGVGLGRAGNFAQASEILNAGLSMNPPLKSVIYYNLAWIDAAGGDTASAIQNYQQALEDDPDPEYTLMQLGLLYEHHQDWEQAFDCFHSVVLTQLDMRSTYLSMLKRSIPHYQTPRDSLSLRTLQEQLAAGVTSEMMFPYDTTLIRQLVDRKTLSDALAHMGITSIGRKLPSHAVSYFEQALSVKPDNDIATAWLRKLRESATP